MHRLWISVHRTQNREHAPIRFERRFRGPGYLGLGRCGRVLRVISLSTRRRHRRAWRLLLPDPTRRSVYFYQIRLGALFYPAKAERAIPYTDVSHQDFVTAV